MVIKITSVKGYQRSLLNPRVEPFTKYNYKPVKKTCRICNRYRVINYFIENYFACEECLVEAGLIW